MSIAIVTFYAAINALIALALALYVIFERTRTGTNDIGTHSVLQQAQRAHGNLTEHVPIILVLLLLLALGGASTLWLHGLGAAVTLGRVLHAFGVLTSPRRSVGRFVGTTLTLLAMLIAIILALRLGLTTLLGGP